MANKATVRIEGMNDLERKLRRMTDRTQGRILREAVQKGADAVRDVAESLAPRAPGSGTRGFHGAENVISEVAIDKPMHVVVHVGARRGRGVPWRESAFWLDIQETGSMYMAAQPWLTPAFDAERAHAERVVADEIKRAVLGASRG